jgi:mono/diheme cytochrome c family protein
MKKPRVPLMFIAPAAFALASAASAAQSQTDAAKAEAGAMIYQDYCSSCHGDELRNTSGGVTFDLRRLRPDEHARFVNSVLNGKKQMPPWRGVLDDIQIESIWAYIRSKVDQ